MEAKNFRGLVRARRLANEGVTIDSLQDELARTKRALEMAKDALKHYAIRDNWQGEKYRGTIHGPAIADEALAAIRKELEG